MCQTSTAAPSHLGGSNYQEKQESCSKRTPKCQLDANSQANALEITQSHFDEAIKQGRKSGGRVISLKKCQNDQQAKRNSKEPANKYL
jgi:hypothetical protein